MRAVIFDARFQERSQALRARGAGVLAVGAVLWAVFVYQVATWDADTASCGRFGERCVTDEGLFDPLWWAAVALPVSLVGLGLFLAGQLRLVMREYHQSMERLD